MHNARVLHVDHGLHVLADELVLQHLDDAVLGGDIEVMLGTLRFLPDPLLHLVDVHRRAVLSQKFLTLHLKAPTGHVNTNVQAYKVPTSLAGKNWSFDMN